MLIEWAESAEKDLSEIYAYFLSIGDEPARKNIVGLLIRAINRLEAFPLSGRPGQIPGTRELIPAKLPYVLIYEVADDKSYVRVIQVIHTSRLLPEDSST